LIRAAQGVIGGEDRGKRIRTVPCVDAWLRWGWGGSGAAGRRAGSRSTVNSGQRRESSMASLALLPGSCGPAGEEEGSTALRFLHLAGLGVARRVVLVKLLR
jgi:hypothetical protein